MNRTSRVFQVFLFAVVIAAVLSSAPVAIAATADVPHLGADSGSGAIGRSAATYIITASNGRGGSISPYGPVQIPHGGSVTFTITPHRDYVISSVVVDGINMGSDVSHYTFSNVMSDHTITASFRECVEWGCDAGTGAFGALATALAAALLMRGKDNAAVKKSDE
jgi:hypothetical protein